MEQEPNEYELALRAREGDREALGELVERTRLRLFALAFAELRHYEDAQDAVAAALVQICLHVTELRKPESIRAWMQRIVRNETHRLRRGPDARMVSLEEVEGRTEGAEPSLLRLDIERALRRLPGSQAEAVRLFHLQGLSMDEVARRLGRSQGTIGSWLYRGRRQMAMEMEGYAPMKATETTPATAAEPSQTAALIHTNLELALVQNITDALRTAGYRTKVITHRDFSRLPELLKGCQVIILDEGHEGCSALEYLIHLRAMPETREMPVNVLCSNPSDFTISAYFITGVARLFRKNDPGELARMARQLERDGFWRQFTERALRVVHLAQEEAARLGENCIGTEHLLLGLTRVPDSVGARILTERLGISLDAIRSEVEAQAQGGPGYQGGEIQLSPRGKRVLDLSDEEARRLNDNYLGAEHLLLGFLREGYGLAARVLTNLGADLERTRQEVLAMRGETT